MNESPVKITIKNGKVADVYASQAKDGTPRLRFKCQLPYADGLPIVCDPTMAPIIKELNGQFVDISGNVTYSENKFGERTTFTLETIKKAVK